MPTYIKYKAKTKIMKKKKLAGKYFKNHYRTKRSRVSKARIRKHFFFLPFIGTFPVIL